MSISFTANIGKPAKAKMKCGNHQRLVAWRITDIHLYTNTRGCTQLNGGRFGNNVGHISKVKLRRARLVLGLVTTFVGYNMVVAFIQATQCGHPSMEGEISTSPFGKRWKVLSSSGPCRLKGHRERSTWSIRKSSSQVFLAGFQTVFLPLI